MGEAGAVGAWNSTGYAELPVTEPQARTLQEDQLEDFNVEHVCEREWKLVEPAFDARFAGRSFSFLDVGGGNGAFADRLLERYPGAEATVLDTAQPLLDRNVHHPRKRLMLASAEHLLRTFRSRRFDLIVFNWALHHFVTSSYRGTRRLQRDVLAQAGALLSDGGVVSVFENLYNGVADGLPGRIIFHATASRAFAPFARKLGANTAGVGVCFLSQRQWEKEARRAGLHVVSYVQGFPKVLGLAKRAALGVRSVHHGHFFMERSPESAPLR